MPIRPRSHRLEDISISRFTALLPEAWVVRRKDQDYGVDLEVEIFEEDGRSTGLIFLVQLRATDDAKKAAKIRLDVAQVEYFQSLSLPTIVVRYCDGPSSFFWQWHFNIAAAMPNTAAKSFTYKYEGSESWTTESATRIRQTLDVRRLIEDYPASQPIHLADDAGSLGFADRYIFERAVENVVSTAPGVLTSMPADGRLTISVLGQAETQGRPAHLILVVDCIASLEIHVPGFDRADTAATIQYGLATLLSRLQLTHHANRISRAILTMRTPASSRYLAFEAARALTSDLERSVDLALLNDIHCEHDPNYVGYIAFLFKAPHEDEGREAAVERFYAAAVTAAHSVGPETAATVHYSLGNFYRVRRRALQALVQYNRARKLRPAYLETGYFLDELGACLFGSSRYKAAARVYRHAIAESGEPLPELHLGDALLFSGRVTEAKAHYQNALSAEGVALHTEALVKHQLCAWLEDEFGAGSHPVLRSVADGAMIEIPDDQQDEALWDRVLRDIDTSNETAHFNLGVFRAGEGDPHRALGHFLYCAFKRSGDTEAWANAMAAAHNCENAELLVPVMTCAHSLGGSGAYDRLRELLLEGDVPDGQIEGLDQISREVRAVVDQTEAQGVTFRAIRENHYDVAVIA